MGPTIATCLGRWVLSQANSTLVRKPDLWEEILATSELFLDQTTDGFDFAVRAAGDFCVVEMLQEIEVSPRIIAILKRSGTFVDVGADIGTYTARAARIMQKPCTIVSF